MSKIDVIKENIQFQKLLREDKATTILKDEYLIPDTHPDVQDILMVEAKPLIVNKESMGDKVMLEGKIEYNIIYIPREDNMALNSVSYIEKFTNYLDLNDEEHKVICEVECKTEHIEARVMNERKIRIEGVLKLNFELYKGIEFEFVKDIQGAEGVQVQKDVEPISRLVASKNVELVSKSMIRVGMDKPQVRKILNCSMLLHKKEIKISEEKIYLSCYCRINILYLGAETKDVIALTDDVYVSKEEELVGVNSNMLPYLSYEIENSDINLEEDDLGEVRIINTEFLVKSNVKIFSKDEINIIKDVYSTKFPLELNRSENEIGIIHGIQGTETIVKDNIYIKEGDLKPEQIVVVLANINVIDKNISDNRLTIEGMINTKILYRTSSEEKGFGQVEGDIPFTIGIEMIGANSKMKSIVKCNLESLDSIIEANTIAIRATINAEAKVSHEVNKDFISEIIEGEGEVEEQKASITIYIVAKEDSIWDLAKKFKTTVDELIKINGIEEIEGIKEGARLIIPGRAVF